LAYIGNMVDFLQRAGRHSIFVIFTVDWMPSQGGYTDSYDSCTHFSDVNTLNLCPGGVAANTAFFHDLAQALVDQGAPLDAILAYELRNEYYYSFGNPPLSWTSGTVTGADGHTSDMSDPVSRQQMMDSGLIYLTDQAPDAILGVDPTALIAVGFSPPQGPSPAGPAIANSTADFVDIHAYPIVGELTLPQIVQNFGFVEYQQQKPVLMG